METSIKSIKAGSYRTTREKVYLFLMLTITFLYYLWAIRSFSTKGFSAFQGPGILLGIVAVLLFIHFLSMASMRINSVKVGPNQFPEIWKAASKMGARLGINKMPDIYVQQAGGILNAFATRLVTRKLLVIYSDLAESLIEGQDQNQLDAVVAHELGHHVLNHTHFYNWFISPGGFLPFLPSASSRARESSADRIMKAVIQDQQACERALAKLAAGKSLGKRVNIEEYLKQIEYERGFFVWLAQITSSHPPLTKRILAIQQVN